MEGKTILSQYLTNKQSGSESASIRGQYATSFFHQARKILFLISHCLTTYYTIVQQFNSVFNILLTVS